jgi:hypothetical protein
MRGASSSTWRGSTRRRLPLKRLSASTPCSPSSASIGVRVHAYFRGQTIHLWQAVAILTMLIGAIGLSLAVLHGLEAALWAVAYLWLGALDTMVQALLFSIDSMATRGASGIVLHQHWEFMGALEAFAGMLTFGISTAYVFQVLLLYWPDLQAVWQRDENGADS